MPDMNDRINPYGKMIQQYDPSYEIPEMVRAKESLQFNPGAPDLLDDPGMWLQQQLYGGGAPWYQRAWDQMTDIIPTSPWEMIPGVGMTKKVGKGTKVVDLDQFRKTGKVNPYEKMKTPRAMPGDPDYIHPLEESFTQRQKRRIAEENEKVLKGMNNQDRLDKVGERLKSVNLKMQKMKDENKSAYEKLRELHSDNPVMSKYMDDIEEVGNNEPYVGQFQVTWGKKLPKGIGHPVPVQNVTDLQGHLGKEVASGGADPFAWIDNRYGRTKKLLDDNYDEPLTLSTRSDLIAHDDYIENINPAKHKIEIHVPGDHQRAARIVEAGAPSLRRRLNAAKKLMEKGYDVTIVHDKFSNVKDGWNEINPFKNEMFKEYVEAGGKIRVNDAGEIDEKLLESLGTKKD